jgi:hypothetical protein
MLTGPYEDMTGMPRSLGWVRVPSLVAVYVASMMGLMEAVSDWLSTSIGSSRS